jgi:hypothetical protein
VKHANYRVGNESCKTLAEPFLTALSKIRLIAIAESMPKSVGSDEPAGKKPLAKRRR